MIYMVILQQTGKGISRQKHFLGCRLQMIIGCNQRMLTIPTLCLNKTTHPRISVR